MVFQEYAVAVEQLRKAYLSDTSTPDAIQKGNIALVSDSVTTDGILKSVVLQAKANDRSGKNCCRKNTFLYQ